MLPDESNPLTSVMFMPGDYPYLFRTTSISTQLDGTRELLDIADSYVLNDRTAVGALQSHVNDNEITSFLLDESSRADSIEIISSDDLDPFRETLGFFESNERIDAVDRTYETLKNRTHDPIEHSNLDTEWRGKREPLFEELNVIEAQAYILFSDKLRASYIPDRLFGYKALESYPELLTKSPHQLREEFLKTLTQRLSIIHMRDATIKTKIPSFLMEALRSSQNAAGIGSALRDLRHSAAAMHYRSMVRMLTDDEAPEADRQKAYEELDAQAKAAFSKDGLEPRIPRLFKLTAALSSFAVAMLFPPAAVVPLLIEVGDEVDRWVRRRQNIFQQYPTGSYEDLHRELKRLFPNIRFEASQLAHFLQTRNFGWADQR